MRVKLLLLLPIAACFITSCEQNSKPPSEEFKRTWYAGKAELTSYAVQQARYGEIRKADVVIIFVSEDFSPEKFVKLDEPEKNGNKVRVLKMNMTKKFITGIYPYAMMLSVFTPVSQDGKGKTLKVACSSQEWCGQSFSQLLLKGNYYNWQLHSYFEKEGEQDKKRDAVLLEDELWNRIRINPASLPQGKFLVLPGLLWQRLSHTDEKAEEATLTLSKADTFFIKDSVAQMYTIYYPAAQRTLQIYFRADLSHEILGWLESYPDGIGKDKKILTTKSVRKKTIFLDYWKHNTIADSAYRDSLQLKQYDY